MWITEFTDYKLFLKALIKTYPKAGFGQARKLALHLNVAPMVVSHILTRDRHFTPDQAVKVSLFFGFDEQARDYFLDLVNFARSDSSELRSIYEARLEKQRLESEKIKNLVKGRDELSDLEKGRFYSDWYYIGVWALSSIKGYHSVETIADYFGLSRAKVGDVVSFLVQTGLCTQEDGFIRVGKKSTHVNDTSPYVNGHRRNWREKAKASFSEPGVNDLFYSSPVTLSKSDAILFRKELLNLISSFSKTVAASPEETFMCLNIDWFKVR